MAETTIEWTHRPGAIGETWNPIREYPTPSVAVTA